MTLPRFRSTRVGIACTWNLPLTAGDSSAFTFTSFNCPASSPASCSSAGLTIRHGTHQGAHTSTSTGMVAASATEAKSVSVAFTTQGSGVWHFPQRGMPCATTGTRFLVWQFEHTTTCLLELFAFSLILPLSSLAATQTTLSGPYRCTAALYTWTVPTLRPTAVARRPARQRDL